MHCRRSEGRCWRQCPPTWTRCYSTHLAPRFCGVLAWLTQFCSSLPWAGYGLPIRPCRLRPADAALRPTRPVGYSSERCVARCAAVPCRGQATASRYGRAGYGLPMRHCGPLGPSAIPLSVVWPGVLCIKSPYSFERCTDRCVVRKIAFAVRCNLKYRFTS